MPRVKTKTVGTIRVTESDLQGLLGLTDNDVYRLREFDAEWDTQAEVFINSNHPLIDLIRVALSYVVDLENYEESPTAPKRVPNVG